MKHVIFYSFMLLAGVLGLALVFSFVLAVNPANIFAIVLAVIFALMIFAAIILAIVALSRNERYEPRC